MTLLQGTVLAVVEGLTEYLPVSSTGHIILSSWIMGINQEEFVKDYTVMVQFGAILAVVVLYWKRFVINTRIYPAVLIGFLPAAVVGLSVKKYIDVILGNVIVVGSALLIGGFLLVLTDKWTRSLKPTIHGSHNISARNGFWVGIFQLFAFIPGVSRSAASIWGGLHQGMNLVTATEFSFFLAVPTLTGASFIKLMKVWPQLTPEHLQIMALGNFISFVVGAASIHYFVRLVGRYGLKYFGYYRIIVGAAVLTAAILGENLSV